MMRIYGRIATGIAAVAMLGMVNVGCSTEKPQTEVRDTWTAASTSASNSASRAEAAASKAEAAASRAEAAAQRVEAAAQRIEAMTMKSMKK